MVARTTIAVRVVGTSGVGGELGQEALPVALADAGRSGQAGAGRGLPGRQLRLVGRPHPRTSTNLPELLRPGRLGCGLVAWPVRVCGLGAGFLFGFQVGLGCGCSRATGRSGAWAMLKATDAAENSPARVHG